MRAVVTSRNQSIEKIRRSDLKKQKTDSRKKIRKKEQVSIMVKDIKNGPYDIVSPAIHSRCFCLSAYNEGNA